MTDLSSFDIEIFQGINDVPVAPTATTGQNISYNNEKHNSLLRELETIIDNLIIRIEDLENNIPSIPPTSPPTNVFSGTLTANDNSIEFGTAIYGFLSDWFIEGITFNDDVNLEFNGSYQPQVANKIAENNGVRFFPATPSEEVYDNDIAGLSYSGITQDTPVTLTLNYQ